MAESRKLAGMGDALAGGCFGSRQAGFLRQLPWLLATVLFLLVLFHTAWLCDDAFISFRTADNFVHGQGLTWNVEERVQAYTHPLWLLLFSAVYAVTQEPYYTAIFLSMAVSMAAVVLFAGRWSVAGRRGAGRFDALLSVAFVDYSTSGLENPLDPPDSGLFLWPVLTGEAERRRPPAPGWLLSLLAALAAVNRMDSILLLLPALAHTLLAARIVAVSVVDGRWAGSRWLRGWASPCSIMVFRFPTPPTPS